MRSASCHARRLALTTTLHRRGRAGPSAGVAGGGAGCAGRGGWTARSSRWPAAPGAQREITRLRAARGRPGSRPRCANHRADHRPGARHRRGARGLRRLSWASARRTGCRNERCKRFFLPALAVGAAAGGRRRHHGRGIAQVAAAGHPCGCTMRAKAPRPRPRPGSPGAWTRWSLGGPAERRGVSRRRCAHHAGRALAEAAGARLVVEAIVEARREARAVPRAGRPGRAGLRAGD